MEVPTSALGTSGASGASGVASVASGLPIERSAVVSVRAASIPSPASLAGIGVPQLVDGTAITGNSFERIAIRELSRACPPITTRHPAE